MEEKEIKMWGKGGVQRTEPLERSNANFISLLNFVELVVTNLTMVYDLWNKPMVSIATEELKYERPLPPSPATLLVLNEVWALGTYEYFQAFPVVFKRFASLFQNVQCVRSQINFTEIRASF